MKKENGTETKRFQENDSGFFCQNCGKEVLPLGKTSRNHCPFCLCSLHVDRMPGDRANPCGGIMDAIRTETDPRRGFVIVHRCRKCGEERRNRAAHGPGFRVQPDDLTLLIRLSAGTGDPDLGK